MSSVYSEVSQKIPQQSGVISSAKSDSRNLLPENGENIGKGQPLWTISNSIWIVMYV